MKKIYKTAVIGLGHIAQKFHIPAIIKNKYLRIISICDNKKSKHLLVNKKFNLNNFYLKSEKMYRNEKFDISCIFTPPNTHFKKILEAIDNNKNIFIEKPFLLNQKEINKIKTKLKKKNIYVQCALHQRFRPISEEIKKLIDKKSIGEIYYINIIHRKFRSIPTHSKVFSIKKNSGGGPLIDLGTHYFDLVFWLLNFPKIKYYNCNLFSKVFSNKKMKEFLPFKKFENEECAIGNIKLHKGLLINFELGYVLNTKDEEIKVEIFGDKGSFTWPKNEYLVLRKNQLIKKKIKLKKYLASINQLENFVKNLSNLRKSSKNIFEYQFIVKLVELLYRDSKKRN